MKKKCTEQCKKALLFMMDPFFSRSPYMHVFGGVMYVPLRENNTLPLLSSMWTRFRSIQLACFHETRI